MSYPSRSDFTSTNEYAAWWGYRRGDGRTDFCATRGGSVVQVIRGSLGLEPSTTWDAALQTALVSLAASLDASQPGVGWSTLRSLLSADLAARRVSAESLRFALFAAIYRRHGLRLDAVFVPQDALLPAWGRALPGSASDGMVCFDPARDTLPHLLSAGERAAAQERSLAGIRLLPGEAAPTPLAPLPDGPAGISNTGLIVGGVALAAAVALVSIIIAKRARA